MKWIIVILPIVVTVAIIKIVSTSLTSTSQSTISKAAPAVATLAGDMNRDGKVDITDVSILLSNWHTSNTIADLNLDGTVSIRDLSILLSNFGKTEPSPTPTVSPSPTTSYPWHTNIVSTTFWVGEIFDPSLPDGSQVCSTYDSQWAFHWSGVNKGTVPQSAAGCPGSIVGGCDGVPGANKCETEQRTAVNGYFPTKVTPLENPFYLDLPYDDLNDGTAFKERCQVIPWANKPGYAGHCTDQNFSYMKNRWVRIIGPNGNTCYGQIQDAGPSHGNLYHDKSYVFGTNDAQPVQGQFNNAGMDVSPALNGCLGFSDLDGQNDKVKWQFVDDQDVPSGPWKQIVTTRQVS